MQKIMSCTEIQVMQKMSCTKIDGYIAFIKMFWLTGSFVQFSSIVSIHFCNNWDRVIVFVIIGIESFLLWVYSISISICCNEWNKCDPVIWYGFNRTWHIVNLVMTCIPSQSVSFCRKKGLKWGDFSKKKNVKRLAPYSCLDGHVKECYEMYMAWEPDRRFNFFKPPAHISAVNCITEISLIVTLNNQYLLTHSRFGQLFPCIWSNISLFMHVQFLALL